MRNRRALIAVVFGALSVAGVATSLSAPRVAAASRVVICHRTHSTTNPYRRITVSVSAVNGSSTNDHTHHVGSPFDPAFSYPSNAKNWGDVIPNRTGGGVDPGLNWDAAGQAIYNGSSVGTKSYAGTCESMTAQQFLDAELAAEVPLADILKDLDEQGADEDAALLRQIGSFSSPTGTSTSFATPTTTTTTTAAPTTLPPTTLAPTTLPPTTFAPTTLPPTTVAPTTVAPTTVAPTTVAPTTVAPSTVAPTTVAPTTVAPTTLPPTTVAPTTLPPTTLPPTTVAPTTLPPTTLPPTTLAPTTLPPTSEPRTSTTEPATSTTAATTSTTETSTPTTTDGSTTTTAAPARSGARVTGVAWFDSNHNDILDTGEARLPGVPVALQPAAAAAPSLRGTALRSGSARTAADGSFVFEGVEPGDYIVTGSLFAAGIGRTWDTDGAADWSVSVHVPAGSTARADMAAVGKGTLVGTVRTHSGIAVPGADVTCEWAGLDGALGATGSAAGADDVAFHTTAGADGSFALSPVPFGEYECSAVDTVGARRSTSIRSVVGTGPRSADLVVDVASSSGPLPATGTGMQAPLLVALLAVAGGAVTMFAVRRPRRI